MSRPKSSTATSSYRADKVFDKNNLGLAVQEVPQTANAMLIPVKAID